MTSIRARLSTGYAAALIGALAVFSVTLLVVRREILYQELEARVQAEADKVVEAIDLARTTGIEPAIAQQDPLAGPSVSLRMRAFLSLIDGYVLVQDSTGYDIYASPAVQQLSTSGRDAFSSAARAASAGRGARARRVDVRSDEVLLATRDMPLGDAVRYRVYAAQSTSGISLAPQTLVGTLLLVTPLLLGVSFAVAYVIAGRAFQPIDHIIDQVEAITDGRSLHRRLAIGAAGEELARLSATLNAFIERIDTSFSALRRFTADASHELKTPLTVIRADIEHAMTRAADETERAIALEEALQQIKRMADLVDSLLTLARADEGRFDLYREPVDLGELARETIETARFLGEDAGLTIDAPIIEEVEVMGDLTRLRQLFLNLVTNAIKYTPRGGRIDITLVRREDEAHFAVRDTGIGISAADLPHVFERFWRADRVRSRGSERGGFGLGLAISQYIAQAHDGSLGVQSRLGRGTTFTVTLPITAPPAPDDDSDAPADADATLRSDANTGATSV